MLNFTDWCEERRLPLPRLAESATKRAGPSQEYPDAYVRSQYPDAYFPPYSATAYLDLMNAKKIKHVPSKKKKRRKKKK